MRVCAFCSEGVAVWALGLLEWVALFSFLQADKLARIINTATKKKENGVFILRLLGVIYRVLFEFQIEVVQC